MSIEINEVETLAAGTGAKLFVFIVDIIGCICIVLAFAAGPIFVVAGVGFWIFGLLYLIERHLRVIATKP